MLGFFFSVSGCICAEPGPVAIFSLAGDPRVATLLADVLASDPNWLIEVGAGDALGEGGCLPSRPFILTLKKSFTRGKEVTALGRLTR